MQFANVKSISGGGLNRRRLYDNSIENLASRQRQLQAATYEFNCILSETDVRIFLHYILLYLTLIVCSTLTKYTFVHSADRYTKHINKL